ncbi:MAG: hypothetical protein AB7W16_04630 [Candidatus Obscuribacterales bacterium]
MIPVNKLPLTMSFLRPSGRALCLLTALSFCLQTQVQTGLVPAAQARSASGTTEKNSLLARKEKKEKEVEDADETEAPAKKKKKAKKKASKEEPAAEEKVAEDEEDTAPEAKKTSKKKHGFFFGGKDKKDRESEPEAVDDEEEVVEVDIIENKPEKKTSDKNEGSEKTAADNKAPRLLPDAALISLLKDVTKSLQELDEETSGVDQPDEKLIVELARQILESSLNGDELEADRILAPENKKAATTTMTVEAWSSGAVEISDKFKGSVAAVWAKKVGGLLNVTIAGDCQDKNLDDGSKVGKFIVVVSAKSPVQKGFDIQSQSQVDFWICELGDVDVDAACMKPEKKDAEESAEEKDAEAEGEDDEKTADKTDENSVKKKSLIVLEPVLTDRKSKYLAELAQYNARLEELAALEAQEKEEQEKEEQEKAEQEEAEKAKAAREKAEQKQEKKAESKEEKPKNLTVESEFAQIQDKEEDKEEAEKPAVAKKEPQSKEPEKKEPEKKEPEKTEPDKEDVAESEPERIEAEAQDHEKQDHEKQDPEKQEPEEKIADEAEETTALRHGWQPKDETPAGAVSDDTAPAQKTAQNLTRISSLPLTPASARSRWESPAPSTITREPSLDARVLLPERAIAGKFLTVAVLTRSNEPERAVELSFNGATMTTDNAGQAMFMVPEDATPGRTLNVSLSARPELNPGVIDVLQPLILSSTADKHPSIDSTSRLATSSKVLVVNGHDFEGMARKNRVLVDSDSEAQVVAASPVELRISLPDDLAAGSHTIAVESQGARSNNARFEYIKAEVTAEEKKKEISRFVVTVKGTQNPVHVRVINRTPDVVKLSKGDSVIITTSGGSHNHYSLGAKRLKKGDYKIEAHIEM